MTDRHSQKPAEEQDKKSLAETKDDSASGSIGSQAPQGRTVKRKTPGGGEAVVQEGLGVGQAPSPHLLPAQYDNDGSGDLPAQSR